MSAVGLFNSKQGGSKAGIKPKRWGWVLWTVLIGYYAAAFFLCRGDVLLALVLPLPPVIVIGTDVSYNS